MPPRVYNLTFTVPAGTNSFAPLVMPWVTEDNVIQDIELMVPPGHNGLTGIRVSKGDVQLLPWSPNTFIVANNYNRVFAVGAYIPTGDLTVQGYNQGAYAHSFFLRMTVTNRELPAGQSGSLMSQAVLAGTIPVTPDPLSPDAILGPDTAAAITAGNLTAADVAPVDSSNLTIPPTPVPAGIG